ncbi:MAG: hypothetical protein IPH45_19445 [Bacteroidales bacterium]|nr:hypothetical protein [Bacteroidales bacterium]
MKVHFPVGGDITGAPFTVAVYAADGAAGMPGTLLDSLTFLLQLPTMVG